MCFKFFVDFPYDTPFLSGPRSYMEEMMGYGESERDGLLLVWTPVVAIIETRDHQDFFLGAFRTHKRMSFGSTNPWPIGWVVAWLSNHPAFPELTKLC